MYNQVNRGPHFGQGSHPMVLPTYQQAPQPPPPPTTHFQQGPPPAPSIQCVPPAPRVYLHGPSTMAPRNVPIQLPPSMMQNTGQPYVIPSQLHGNNMATKTNTQHPSNLGVQSHHISPPVPPSWAPGPPSRVLPPPPPPPPFHSHPPQPAPPPSGPGFIAPSTDGVFLHSNVGNYQVSSTTLPPLPSSPPPIPPSPPPHTPPMTSASSHDAHSDPNSSKVSGVELNAVGSVDEVVAASCPSDIAPVHSSDPNQDSGSCRDREVAVVDRGELLSTRSVILGLPPPPPQPTEEKTVQKIEALCQLIADNGPDIEDKIRQDELENPEYAFLFGGDPGTEAAISHAYFLWMKKKYNLEYRWHEKKTESHEKKTESQLRPLSVESSGKQYHLHVAIESADSDMEMEDDITLSDKAQGSNFANDNLTQQHDRVDEGFSINENIHKLQNLTENDPAKDILSSGASCFGSIGVSKQHEGPRLLSDLEDMKSARSVTKYHNPMNDSTEVAEFSQGTVFVRSASYVDDDGASGHNEASGPDIDSRQLIKSGSPIRLLQDYASDDTSDNEDESCGTDANVLTVCAGAATGVSVAQKDSGSYLGTDIGTKNPSSTQKGFGLLSKTYQIDSEICPHPVQEFNGRSVSHWSSSDVCIEHNLENHVSVNSAASIDAFHAKDGLSGTGIDSGSKSVTEKEHERKTTPKFEQNIIKVDEFGRHPREGPADSDSDDSRYYRTGRLNKRDRSRSRSGSRSPRHRRTRRRSPRRKRGKRSRSRSWSPRHRRSRSKSPILRRSGNFGGENVKRDKGQCFDFFRGKCYRGASCRYIHHESDKNASSRRYTNKHDMEVCSRAKNSGINEGMKNTSSNMSAYERDGVRSQEVDLCQNVTGQEVEHQKEDSDRQAVVSTTTFGLDGKLVNNDPVKSESFRKVDPEVQETLVVREERKALVHDNDSSQKAVNSHQQHLVDVFQPEALSSVGALKPSGGAYEDVIPSKDDLFVQQIQSNVSAGVLEHSGHTSQLINVSSVSDASCDKRSMISASASMVSSSELTPYMLPSTQQQSAPSSLHSQASKEIHPHSSSSGELPLHTYQLPALPLVSHFQGGKVMPQIPRGYDVMQQNAFFPLQLTTRGKFEHYPAPLHTQNFHFNLPPNRTSLPLPPPLAVNNSNLNSGVTESYISAEFNQSQLHSRTGFISQTSVMPGLSTHSQSSEFQDQAYTPMQDHSRTLMLTEALSPKYQPQGNPAGQSLSGPNLSRDDRYKQLSISSTTFDGLHPQSKQFSWESDANRLQPSTTSCFHPLSQKQQSVYSFQYSASENNLGVPGESITVSRYPPDILDGNHSTSLPAFGGSRVSAHYNPYASTFEQPISSKFSSSIFRQENDIIHRNNYGSSGLNHTPLTREGVGNGGGSRHSASSPKSARAAGQMLLRSGDNQYDPLVDCIEPSPSSLKKFNFYQNQEVTCEPNFNLRPKSSYMSLDVEEMNKHEEVGAVASTTSQNNDEYGETADAEVGAVENESLSNHVDDANMTTGDVEINQIKSPGKRRKNKDSRSMRLFKISIANFVKEVLKPSWRQGNMSKVAFKTIVKKTVDKVSGAMKGHRVPKSQAKISQYIDSSQRKLTKLVMGYVDKYVKV